jgi:hypothetical protein
MGLAEEYWITGILEYWNGDVSTVTRIGFLNDK